MGSKRSREGGRQTDRKAGRQTDVCTYRRADVLTFHRCCVFSAAAAASEGRRARAHWQGRIQGGLCSPAQGPYASNSCASRGSVGTYRDSHTVTRTQTHRHRHTDTDTHTQTQTHTHTDTHSALVSSPPPTLPWSCWCRHWSCVQIFPLFPLVSTGELHVKKTRISESAPFSSIDEIGAPVRACMYLYGL